MQKSLNSSIVVTALVAAIVGAIVSLAVTSNASQGQTQGSSSRPSETPDGRPNFGGVWQALNEAHWDLEAHEARPGMVMQDGIYPYEYAKVPAAPVLALGAAAGVPGSIGVVQGDGTIPYKPETLRVKQENNANWIDRDPELKCYLPGIPRAMYMPYPFQIVQSEDKIQMTFGFSNAARVIHLTDVTGPPDYTFMGHSVGRWEGDTLVVETSNFLRETSFRAGVTTADLLLVERFTRVADGTLMYEVTVEDTNTWDQPWSYRMAMVKNDYPLYEYACHEGNYGLPNS